MAQHDYHAEDNTGAGFRLDLNALFMAVATQNMGPTAPAPTYPMMPWPDTTSEKFKVRSTDNNSWIVIGDLNTPGWGLATLASPDFTGAPTAPTPAEDDNSDRLATTAMVQAAAAALLGAVETVPVNLAGTITSGSTIFVNDAGPSGGADGDIWFEY